MYFHMHYNICVPNHILHHPHHHNNITVKHHYDHHLHINVTFFTIHSIGIVLIFMPESPMFLLLKGRHDETIEILQKIYEQNTSNPSRSYPVSESFDIMIDLLLLLLLKMLLFWLSFIDLIVLSILQLLLGIMLFFSWIFITIIRDIIWYGNNIKIIVWLKWEGCKNYTDNTVL